MNNVIKKSKTERIILGTFFVIFALYAISLIFPFFWLVNNSFKTHTEFFSNVWSLPEKLLFGNYLKAIQVSVGETSFIQMILNSLFLSSILTFIGVVIPAMSAYVTSKYKFKLKWLCIAISLILVSVPTFGGTAAVYKLFKAAHIYNSYFSIFLLGSGGFGFGFLLLYGAFSTVSWEYAEAAFIDGASDFRVFLTIMLPMVSPVVLTLTVLGFLGCWNDYFSVFMFAPGKPTLAVGIQQFADSLSSADANYPLLFAIMLLSLIPAIILYTMFQKPIMNSAYGGGIKG